MTFGIVGMGKMGQAICSYLSSSTQVQFHPFNRLTTLNQALFLSCDVIIEFTISEAAPQVIRQAIEANIPVVSGTTGWHEYHLDSIIKLCKEKRGKFLYATNFSIGMNITFALNRNLAMIMNNFPQFKASITEIHHVHKKDSPSGTAYTLIEDILDQHSRYKEFELIKENKSPDADKLPVTAIREGEVKGYHEVCWNSGLEQVRISHEAFDRKIFAEGAILAATWLKDKPPGVYTMRDIIRI